MVFDTNATISAILLPKLVSRKAFDLALEQGTSLLARDTYRELMDVLSRSRFERYIMCEDRLLIAARLLSIASFSEPSVRICECRDPPDDKVLELAVDGKADVIVSGNRDLWVLHPFRGIPILAPSAFVRKWHR